MKKPAKNGEQTIRVLNRIAVICGAVSCILCILIVANYIQVRRVDPLNTPAMTTLLERLKSNPGDEALRAEIRELDLLSRKAFFTSWWQIRTGGYILLACVLIIIICLKWIELIRPELPPFPEPERETFWNHRRLSQRWIIYTGMVLVAGSLVLAWLTYTELDETIHRQEVAGENRPVTDADPVEEVVASRDLPETQTDSFSTGAAPIQETETQTTAAPFPAPYPTRGEILSNSVTFRGPDGNGVFSGTDHPVSWNGSTGEHILWKTSIPLPGNNSPVVWKERVFLTGATASRQEVYCVDAFTGTLRWQTEVSAIPGRNPGAPAVDRETGLAAPSATTDGKRVYAIFASGDLVAMDLEGRQVWGKNLGLPKNHYGHSSSLIMYQDLLIVQWDQSQGASVKAFDGATGELIWNTPRNVRVSWASPILATTGTRVELILAADPMVAAYDPATGRALWQVECIFGEVGPSPAYAGGYVFATNEYAKLAAIRLGNPPAIAWEKTDYLSDIPSPVANDQFLFLATSYGVVVCYDAKTGEEYWMHELNNSVYASPVLAGDKLYIQDKTGVMHILKAGREFQQVGTAILGEGSVCTPAFTNGKIYIRGEKHLFCIEP